MDIATLAGGLAAAHQLPPELEAARTGQDAPTAAPAAVTRLRLASPEPAAGGGSAFAAMPASSGFLPRAAAIVSAARGYATGGTAASARAAKPAPATGKTTSPKPASSSSSSKKATAATPATTTSFTSQELSFLKDKRLSVEEKLFRFMTLLVQKGDQQLVDTMNAYAGKTSTSAGSSAKGSSSSKAGSSGTKADAGGGVAKELAAQLGGPLLAAAATAFGAPELAPAALQIGGKVGEAVVDLGGAALGAIGSLFGGGDGLTDVVGTLLRGPGVAPAPAHDGAAGGGTAAGGSASTGAPPGGAAGSASAPATTASGGSELDEKLVMLDLQRLVEKQNVMFSALSNVLKAMHDGQMTAVQNIR